MSKYFIAMLLLGVTVLWSTASANPQNIYVNMNDFIDETIRLTVKKIRNGPEPYVTRFTNLLKDVKRKDWSSIDEFINWTIKSGDELYKEIDKEEGRVYEFSKSKEIRAFYAGTVVAAAPPAYKSALQQKYDKILDRKYGFIDFVAEVVDIFENVTGINLYEYATKLVVTTQSED